MRRIGIIGGTFDPIHLGHLSAAEAARGAFSLSKVIFVPAGVPPHKSAQVTDAKLRLGMVEAAVAGKPFFEVSDFEVNKPGKSYTIDTIEHFKNVFANEDELFFITGSDAICEIFAWRDVSRLMEICKFIAVSRPGHAGKTEIEKLPNFISSRVEVIEVQGLSISSTEVRDLVEKNQSIGSLVPKTVEDYIIEYGLYR